MIHEFANPIPVVVENGKDGEDGDGNEPEPQEHVDLNIDNMG